MQKYACHLSSSVVYYIVAHLLYSTLEYDDASIVIFIVLLQPVVETAPAARTYNQSASNTNQVSCARLYLCTRLTRFIKRVSLFFMPDPLEWCCWLVVEGGEDGGGLGGMVGCREGELDELQDSIYSSQGSFSVDE